MTQNVWEQEAVKDLMQSEEWEAVRMSILFFTLMQVLYIYKHK